MIYIIDDNEKYVGEFGSSAVVGFFADAAEEHDLPFLKNFLELGLTIELRGVIDEIGSVEWPIADGKNEIAAGVISALSKCRSMAFLTE